MKKSRLSLLILLAMLSWNTAEAADYSVTTFDSGGTGSFQWAFDNANADTGTDPVTITFQLPSSARSELNGYIPINRSLSFIPNSKVEFTTGTTGAPVFRAADGVTIGGLSSMLSLHSSIENGTSTGIGGLGAFTVSGTLDSMIDASVGGLGRAYAVQSNGSLTIGTIGRNSLITASSTSADNTAGYVYGVRANGDHLSIGTLAGRIETTSRGATAIGVAGGNILMEIGTLSGTITSVSNGQGGGDKMSEGIFAFKDLQIGNLSGKIESSRSAGGVADAIYATDNVNIDSLSGQLSASVSLSTSDEGGVANVNGIRANNKDIHLGTLASGGEITVNVDMTGKNGIANATGLYAGNDINIGTMENGFSITAKSQVTGDGGNGAANGVFALRNITVTNLGGTIRATMTSTGVPGTEFDAYGISGHGTIDIGTLSGKIEASVDNGSAYGIYSDRSDVKIGNMSGSIKAYGSMASYGVLADGNLDVAGVFGGEVTAGDAVSPSSSSVGASAYTGHATFGSVSGTMTVTATKSAQGLETVGFADGSVNRSTEPDAGKLSVAGNLGGKMTVNAIGDGLGTITYARGVVADQSITIGGQLTGSIDVLSANGVATGLNSYNANINIGGMASSGSISAYGATASVGVIAHGDFVVTGDLGGSITAGSAEKPSLFAMGAVSVLGDSTIGSLSATVNTTGSNMAIGLGSTILGSGENVQNNGNLTIQNDMSGTISATASGSGSFAGGIVADNNVSIGSMSGAISANGGTYAYGIKSFNGNIGIGGDMSGSITASASAAISYTEGIVADNNITIGKLSGNITASGGAFVFGINALNGRLDISGEMSGTISATSNTTGGGFAKAIVAKNGISIGNLSGSVTATGNAVYAVGVESSADVTIGTMTGKVTANGQSLSEGIAALGNVTVTGDLGGAITVGNSGSPSLLAYGIDSLNGSVILGSVSGSVDVSGSLSAYGIAAESAYGGMDAGNVTVTGNLGGSITANATDANKSSAYGVLAVQSLRVDGKVTGTISASSAAGTAAGIMSMNSDVTLGGMSGTATVSAFSPDTSIGIGANGSLTVNGDLGGTINAGKSDIESTFAFGAGSLTGDSSFDSVSATVKVTGSNLAIGLGATILGSDQAMTDNGNLSIKNDMSGKINVTSGDSDGSAYGIVADNAIRIGSLIGTVTVTGVTASGIESFNGPVTIGGNLSGKIGVTGTGDINPAVGIGAVGDITIGGISGSIDATSGNNAYGIRAVNGAVGISGNISGKITARAESGNSDAVGIAADKDITIGSMSGSVSSTGALNAYGIRSLSGAVIINGDMSGTITAADAAFRPEALGIVANNDVTIGTMSGSVTVTGNYHVAGLQSQTGAVAINGAMSGAITASARGEGTFAAGILAQGDISVPTVSGMIQASGNDAFGLMSNTGGLHGSSSASPMLVSGTVNAQASTVGITPGVASALISSGPMNLQIAGTVSATVDGDASKGYAVYSGTYDRLSGFTLSSADNNLLISGNARVIGNIVLGSGNDTVTLSGNADITGVHTLDGGKGGTNTLVMDGWGRSIAEAEFGHSEGDSVVNWDSIQLRSGSYVHLGHITGFNVGTLSIDATSLLDLHGNSPSTYTITGNVVNNGVISFVDPSGASGPGADDITTITGDYSGNGTLKFDVLLGSSMHDTLVVDGNASGSTTLVFNDVATSGGALPSTISNLVTVGGTNSLTYKAGEYDHGSDVYTFDLSTSGTDLSLGNFQFVGFQEPVAVMQGVTPFIEHLAYESINRFHDRSLEGKGWWARSFGSRYHLNISGQAGTKISGYSAGMQAGVDLTSRKSGGGVGYDAGIFAGTGYSHGDVAGFRIDKAGQLSDYALSVGIYANAKVSERFWLDSVVMSSNNNLRMTLNDENLNVNKALWGVTFAVESGYSVPVSEGFMLEPHAQLLWQHSPRIEATTGIGNVVVGTHEGLYGKFGISGQTGGATSRSHALIELNAMKDFSTLTHVSYLRNDKVLTTSPEKLFVGGAVGLKQEAAKDGSGLSYFIKAELMAGVDGGGSNSFGFSAGLSKMF
ncbi:MAG: hypothetical protein HGB22_01740 [Chlorobiaceae bacterium]|nr:hypothetical protein [Chlorobiaceae bacterium]